MIRKISQCRNHRGTPFTAAETRVNYAFNQMRRVYFRSYSIAFHPIFVYKLDTVSIER